MKINFELILNPEMETRSGHVITGKLADGSAVVVERRLSHWNVNLKITVNGHVQHDTKFTDDDRQGWCELRRRALDTYDADVDEKYNAAKKSGAVLFTFAPGEAHDTI